MTANRIAVSESAAATLLIVGLMIGAVAVYVALPTKVTTETVTEVDTSVTTTTVVTTPTVPKQVTVSGTFSTNGVGTTPVAIHFISSASGISYPGQTSGNSYTVVLPNPDTYTVKIDGSNFGGIGGGTCTAGNLPLYEQFPVSVVANWAC
jgi:hypothetical protein